MIRLSANLKGKGMEFKKLELFGHVITLPPEKVATNTVRTVFSKVREVQRQRITTSFHTLFSNLDGLYERGDMIANEVRVLVVEQAMQVLATHGLYEVSEQVFFERFMGPYDHWDEDFAPIAQAYEAIVERTAELDAYRTARRQNRDKWVGFSQQAVHQADAKNLISNVGHGMFNLMAKGVTAIGNSLKKDEIFNNPDTLTRFREGIADIVSAGMRGVEDALESLKPGSVHLYSDEEARRCAAIVEHVQKGRVPEADMLSALLRAIDAYPYTREAYALLLKYFGADHSRLDAAAEFFGITGLEPEKRQLFSILFNSLDLTDLAGVENGIPALQAYAYHLSLPQPETDSAINKALTSARKNAFELEVAKHPVSSLEDLKRKLPIIEAHARAIGFEGFSVWSEGQRARFIAPVGLKGDASRTVQKVAAGPSIDSNSGQTLTVRPMHTVLGLLVIGSIMFGAYKAYEHITGPTPEQEAAFAAELEAFSTPLDVVAPSAPQPAIESDSQASSSSVLEPSRPALSPAAAQAVSEGFVDITDPAVQACTEAKVAAFRKELGEDAPLRYDVFNEFAVACGFNL